MESSLSRKEWGERNKKKKNPEMRRGKKGRNVKPTRLDVVIW